MDRAFWKTVVVILTLNEPFTQSKSNRTGTFKANKMEGYIVGGGKTTIDRYPHAVCLFQSPDNVYFCGASVVNQIVLVTAAHCLEGDRSINTYDAYAGHEDVERVMIIRRVVDYVVHKGYDPEWVRNDIGLLFLKEPLPLGGDVHVKRVIIPFKYPFEVQHADITGWGLTEDNGKMSTVLKVVKQDIVPLAECLRQYPEELSPGMMCAGDSTSSTNRPFKGDSGGGLITKNYQLIGVVSFTMSESAGLVIYTNLTFYHDWIFKKIRETCRVSRSTPLAPPMIDTFDFKPVY